MEPHEFTEQRWLTPQECLNQYYKKDIPMLIPQLICFLHINLIRTLAELKNLAISVFDQNLISYSSIAFEVRDLNRLPEEMKVKAI
jgi:hypothetical protein